jgi:hypothetical protein
VIPGCADLHRDLPATLRQGLHRRSTNPPSQLTSAWGTPPVVLRCGVASGKDTDELFTFNQVQWAMHDIGSARRWTTRGLRVDVEVVVPDAYSSQAELLGGLARVLRDDLGR